MKHLIFCKNEVFKAFVVFMFWNFSLTLFAQSHELNLETSLKNYQIKTWNEIGETTIERVFDISQDSIGYLWIASDRGLLRFDGFRVEVYNLRNVPVLETESIRLVKVAKNGTVWFSTRRGLYYLKDGQVSEIRSSDNKKIKSVFGLHLDSNDNLWFTNREKLFAVKNFELTEFKNFNAKPLRVFTGKNGNAWIYALHENKRSIYKLTGNEELEKRKVNKIIDFGIQSIAENNKGDLYIGGVNGKFYTLVGEQLSCYNCAKKSVSKTRIYDIICDDSGAIWVGTNGLHRVVNNSHDVLNAKNGLTANTVNCLFKDKVGNLWVGTINGLNLLSNTPFELYAPNKEYLSEDIRIRCLIKDVKGAVVAGSLKHGLWYLQNKQLEPFKGAEEIGTRINSISTTNISNEYVVGTELGLFKVRRDKNQLTVLKKYAEGKIRYVFVAKNSDIWFSEFYRKIGEGRSFHQVNIVKDEEVNAIEELSDVDVSWIFETESGVIKLGTHKGVFEYKNNQISEIDSNGYLNNKWIQDFISTGKDNFWVSTYGSGIVHFSGSNITSYTTRNGLPRNQAYKLFNSSGSGLWFYIFNSDYGKIRKIIPFVKNDGANEMGIGEVYILSDDFDIYAESNDFPNKIENSDGSSLIAGRKGIVRFNPKSVPILEPKVLLQKIICNDSLISIKESIVFEANANDFEFHYSGIDFQRRKAQIFEYKLEGLDEKWRRAGLRRVAYYSQIPSGNYEFKVRQIKPDGGYYLIENPIQITKKEYWYKTNWAYASFGLLALLLIIAIFKYRVKAIEGQRQALAIKVEERTSELKDLNENLEQKVIDRTKEIVEINEVLEASDERYRYALEASNDGIWDYNIKEDKISLSPSIYTMLGFEPYEFPETRADLYALISSEDIRNKTIKAHEEIINNATINSFQDEYKMLNKNGEIVWIHVKGKIVERDENNNPLRVVGTHINVTEEKLRNQKILETILKTENTERSRIAKDIHDGLQQTLTVALLNFQTVKKELKYLSEKAANKFEIGFKYLQSSIEESRAVSHSLMPKAVVDFGIVPAISKLVATIDNANEATTFNFQHNLKKEKLPNQQIEITIYRILQEAINNINKYAKATKVDIQLMELDDIYLLTIEDDGVGFNKETLNKEGKGLGFKSMKNRLEAIDGFVEVDSQIGKGTNILVEINKINS